MGFTAEKLNKNRKVAQQLDSLIKRGNVVHAFAFTGGSFEDRSELGNWFASYLLCDEPDGGSCGICLSCRKLAHGNHQDYILVKKPDDRESIVKDQILELISRLSMKPYGGKYVVVIEDAQLMNAAAQNKLLKTLEEPVSEAVVILLTEREEGLLQTVLSRCCVFHLEDDAESSKNEAEYAAEFAGLIMQRAPFYKKKAVLSDILSDKDNARARGMEFLDNLEAILIAELKKQAVSQTKDNGMGKLLPESIKHTENARKYLKQLHSVSYTLKQLCLRV